MANPDTRMSLNLHCACYAPATYLLPERLLACYCACPLLITVPATCYWTKFPSLPGSPFSVAKGWLASIDFNISNKKSKLAVLTLATLIGDPGSTGDNLPLAYHCTNVCRGFVPRIGRCSAYVAPSHSYFSVLFSPVPTCSLSLSSVLLPSSNLNQGLTTWRLRYSRKSGRFSHNIFSKINFDFLPLLLCKTTV